MKKGIFIGIIICFLITKTHSNKIKIFSLSMLFYYKIRDQLLFFIIFQSEFNFYWTWFLYLIIYSKPWNSKSQNEGLYWLIFIK